MLRLMACLPIPTSYRLYDIYHFHLQGTGIQLGTIVLASTSILIALILSFISSWELTFLLMLTFPLVFITYRLNNKLYKSTGSGKIDTLQESAHVITETIDHIKTVVTLGAKEYFVKSIKRHLQSHSWYVASNTHCSLELYIYNMAPMVQLFPGTTF